MKKEIMILGIIFLFAGISIAPGITANNSLIKNRNQLTLEKETVDFTVEVCGLNGGKQKVELTKEEAEEVQQLFISIRSKLNETETKEEAVEVFKEAVIELDKYGLFGELNVKPEQCFLTIANNLKNTQFLKLINIISGRWKQNYGPGIVNKFCLVLANIEKGSSFNFEFNIFAPILFIYGAIGIYTKLLDELAWLSWCYSQLKPFRFLNIVAIYNDVWDSKIPVYSLGLLGFKNTLVKCNYFYGITGFTGIIIKTNCEIQHGFPFCDTFYFGSALKTELIPT